MYKCLLCKWGRNHMVHSCAHSLHTPTHPLTNTLTHPHADRLLEASIFLSVQSNDHVASSLDSSEHFKRKKRALQKKQTPPCTCVAAGLEKKKQYHFFKYTTVLFYYWCIYACRKACLDNQYKQEQCVRTLVCLNGKVPAVIIKLTVQLVNFIFHPNI